MTTTFASALRGPGVLLLDGALATELEGQGEDLSGGLWSARVLRDAPERVARVHLDYLTAGADCVITASYQATVEGLVRAGASPADARSVLRRSVSVARGACDEFASQARPGPFVAASVGPYGAYLADGTPLREIAVEVARSPSVVAVGVNCTAPRHIDALICELSAASDAPIIVYPNSGEGWDAEAGRWCSAGPRLDLVAAAAGWIDAGAKIIGGCCRTTPADIAGLRALIDGR